MAGPNNLNVFSDSFDALSAIYAENVVIPWKKAPVLDNVAKYESLSIKSEECESVDQTLVKEKEEIKQKRVKAAEDAVLVERKISLQAKPDEEQPKVTKSLDNILTLIEKTLGPLGFLKDCMKKRIRVKVWTRNHSQMRGFSEGFVVAFDKHWNIAMEDVTEIWSRRRKRKSAPLGIGSERPPGFTPVAMPPPIEIIKRKKKTETCKRHLNQVMIRGEHVVLVSVISS